ncbi:MAG: hypothetical protein QNJ34_06305 [Xenococcaceae cyanobacterium MO_188.B29]|nr:hypothetical protein [Xenococcaceae cyanobacterium MO_188.B29]
MEQQNQIQAVAPSQPEEEKSKKERVKATFSLLNHLVKIYNEGETYVKRGLTLFGLGSIIAGVSFGAGQQVSQKETDVLNSLNNSSTSQVQSNPQPVINHTLPNGQPSVIYLAPIHSQHGFIPTHNPLPITAPINTTNLQVQPASTPVPTSKTVTSSPIKTAPTPVPASKTATSSPVQPASNPVPNSKTATSSSVQPASTPVATPKSPTVNSKPEVQTTVRKPAIFKQPESEPINREKQNTVKQPSIFKPSQPESVNTVLTDIEQTVEPLQQVSGILSGLKRTVEPWVNEGE